MSNSWPQVPLGEVLTKSEDWTDINPTDTYREITVRLWGKGVTLRREASGAEIASPRRLVAKAGQFILSRIDARNGALGLVPDSLDGAVVSNDFPVFTPNPSRLLPPFLDWVAKTRSFVEICKAASEGTTNRVRLQEDRFLKMTIPLPTLSEQRRIVARIEVLAAKISEACSLRQQTAEEADRLLICMAHRDDLTEATKGQKGWQRVQLGEIMDHVDDSHQVQADQTFPNLGIYSFGRGLFHKPPIDGTLTSATTLRRVRKGQFIYSRLFAFEGAYGFVTDEFDGYFVSNEYPTFDCDPHRVRAEFVAAYFKSPTVWKGLAAGSKGLGDRRQRVQPDKILSHTVWLPPLEWQDRIAEVQAQVDPLKKLQAQTAAAIDAMLPSILDRAFKGNL
jgi:type I restriction enzyme, S subunit